MSVCKGCGKPIVWIRTEGGKSMPCEPDPVQYWPGSGDRVVLDSGKVISASLQPAEIPPAGSGRLPHWNNCPAAEYFKQKAAQEQRKGRVTA